MTKPIQERIYKSRLTITYRTNIDGQTVPQKLPLRILVLGDFSGRGWRSKRAAAASPGNKTPNAEPGHRFEDRRVISIKRGTRIEDVMADMAITVPIPSYDHRELCGTARGDFASAVLQGSISEEGVAQLKGSVELSAEPDHGDGGFKGIVDAGWSLPTLDVKLSGKVGDKDIKDAAFGVVLLADAVALQTFKDVFVAVEETTALAEAATKTAEDKLKAKNDAVTAKATVDADAGADADKKTAAATLVDTTTRESTEADAAKSTAVANKGTAVSAADAARLDVDAFGYARIEAKTGTWKAAGDVKATLKLKQVAGKLALDTSSQVTFTGKDEDGKDVPATGTTPVITITSTANVDHFVISPLTLLGKIGGGLTGRVGPVDSEVTGEAIAIKILSARIEPGVATVTVSGGAMAKLAIPITDLDSFGPDNVAGNIHEIRRLLLLKSLLAELSSYVSNRTEMRQKLFDALPSLRDPALKEGFKAVYPKLLTAYQPNGSAPT